MKYLLILLPIIAYSQGLDEYGQHFKDNNPASYEVIKQHAIEKWNDDYSMVIFSINKQSKACYEFFQYYKDNEDNALAYRLIQKWTYKGFEATNEKLLDKKRILELHVDWSMIYYEYKKQIEAKNSF